MSMEVEMCRLTAVQISVRTRISCDWLLVRHSCKKTSKEDSWNNPFEIKALYFGMRCRELLAFVESCSGSNQVAHHLSVEALAADRNEEYR